MINLINIKFNKLSSIDEINKWYIKNMIKIFD